MMRKATDGYRRKLFRADQDTASSSSKCRFAFFQERTKEENEFRQPVKRPCGETETGELVVMEERPQEPKDLFRTLSFQQDGKLRSLEEQLKESEATRAHLEDECVALQQRAADAEAENASLQQLIGELQNRASCAESSTKEEKERVQQLRDLLEIRNSEIQGLKKELLEQKDSFAESLNRSTSRLKALAELKRLHSGPLEEESSTSFDKQFNEAFEEQFAEQTHCPSGEFKNN